MAFQEIQFPPEISYGASGGPTFSTDIITLNSGHETRNQNWSVARREYNVAHTIKNQTDLDSLIQFFINRKGRFNSFRFKDWTDYSATTENLGTGDASEDTFQIRKAYTDALGTVYRDITKPVSGTLLVYVNAVLQTVTTHYTIDYTTGIITFVTPPGNGLAVTATYEFDVPCRFDTDEMPVTIDFFNDFSWNSIPIKEVRI